MPGRYAAGEAWFMALDRPVYGLAQCTRDMGSELCSACLRGVLSELPRRIINTSQEGGRLIGVRCVVRYELDPFFEMDDMTLQLDMPNGTKKNKTWIWVGVALAGAAVCVSCFVLFKELKKRTSKVRATKVFHGDTECNNPLEARRRQLWFFTV